MYTESTRDRKEKVDINMDKSVIESNNIGNFTKLAVEKFESNIVNKTNYLESIKENRLSDEYKFKEGKDD